MKDSSTIIGVVCLLVFMGPILYLVFRERKKGTSFKKKISDIAKAHQLSEADAVELGHITCILNKPERRGIFYFHHNNIEKVVAFNRANADEVDAKYETETIESGHVFTSKITLVISSDNHKETLNIFDEAFPNQLASKYLVPKTKNLLYDIQKM